MEAKEKISEELLNQVFPGVWASNVPGRARNAFPIQMKLKEGKQPVKIKQYPLRKEDRGGISLISENFLQLGLLKECQSDFNTPILPVCKPDGSFQVVQDLQAVNKITEDLYSMVANLYTLLMCLTPEKQEIALGILAQDLGPYRRAVVYLSKQLDAAAKGWLGCLRAVVAVVLNIQEACKFTLGQKMTVLVSHTVSSGLETKEGHWLSPQRFLKYQAVMVEQDDVEIVVTNIVNPASFFSGNQGEPIHHNCLETIEATYSCCSDLKDTPLDDAETWFTNGSSFIINGKRHAGVVHTHEVMWKERGLLNSQGKNTKHSQEIIQLLEAVQLPEKVAIMHIKAHQKVSSELKVGNELVDREAKEATKGEETVEGALIPNGKISLEDKPGYHKKDRRLIEDEKGKI
ncbi:hypothetical protein HGM15179_019867 [Zosterops borbonicus]|uniref:RNase H type-1 domain-containing protein n=1 Tax=Zosterops borbonicus TaxID=364589 RepID=A0A8K1D9T4_9PASS|nr:hypothetical protein HGM15179_019867 [Zosterops borbonicus]